MKKVLWILVISGLVLSACATDTKLRIESKPESALILYSKEKDGPWKEYKKDKGLHTTPSVSEIKKKDFFWVKLSKEGYRDTEPYFVRAVPHQTVNVSLDLPSAEKTVKFFVDSEPQGAKVMIARSEKGGYQPWPEAQGTSITPAQGEMPMGETFWVKVEKEGHHPSQPVRVDMTQPENRITLKLDKGGAQRAELTVTTDPPLATILVSKEENGHYEPWPPDQASQQTPMTVPVDVGTVFWLKARKDQYNTTAPIQVNVRDTTPLSLQFALTPAEKRTDSAVGQEPQPSTAPVNSPVAPGIVAVGYALADSNTPNPRNAAILDALGAAIQQEYGAELMTKNISENYALLSSRIESIASGKYAKYDVLEESSENGLYRVKLRVLFEKDLLKAIQGENVSFAVGTHEVARIKNDSTPMEQARSAAADVLISAGIRVSSIPGDCPSATELAKRALDSHSDVALYLSATTECQDRFGQFLSYKTVIDYTLLIPVKGDIVATGRIEGVNEDRKLSDQEAASASLRDIGKKAAEEAIRKLAERYDRAASYTVYVFGVKEQREVDALVSELGTISGVRDARALRFENVDEKSDKKACLIGLTIAPDARPAISVAVQRLKNIDLQVVEADLYNAVAWVR